MNRFINPRFERVASQIGLIAVGLIVPLACAAQIAPSPVVREGAPAQLARFEENAKTGKSSSPDALRHPENYARATVDAVADGLENIALSKEPDLVRQQAVIALTGAGSKNQPIAGMFDRVTTLYKRSDHFVCVMIISYIARGQDRARGIEFLKSTATASAPLQCDSAPFLAAQELSFTGAEGRAILRELYSRGALTDPRARDFARWFLSTPPRK